MASVISGLPTLDSLAHDGEGRSGILESKSLPGKVDELYVEQSRRLFETYQQRVRTELAAHIERSNRPWVSQLPALRQVVVRDERSARSLDAKLHASGSTAGDPVPGLQGASDAMSVQRSIRPRLFVSAGPEVDDFSAGLVNWTNSGDVSVSSEEMVLGDSTTNRTITYRPFALAPETYTIEFDFNNQLSDTFDTGTFPDVFFASMYFTDDLGAFSIVSNMFAASLALMDLDYIGPYNVLGTIGASIKGPQWSHYTGTFTTSNTYSILAFELDSLNETSGDSAVRIDNISITVVPEPASILLVALGLAFLLSTRRRLSPAPCLLVLLLPLGASFAGNPTVMKDISAHCFITTTNERTTLDRATGNLVSTVDVSIYNLGGRVGVSPLHCVVHVSTSGVAVAGASAGFGQLPYGQPYFDLSGQLTAGRFESNDKLTRQITFTRHRTIQFTYAIEVLAGLESVSPPSLTVPPQVFVGEGQTVDVPAQASDPDGGVVTIEASPMTDTMELDATNGNPATATLRFTPAFDEAGVYSVEVTARDETGYVKKQTVEITVTNINRGPYLFPPDAVEVDEGTLLSIQLEASDIDGDSLVYSSSNLPPNAVLVPDTGEFFFAPDFSQAGVYTVPFAVADGGGLGSTQALQITVLDVPSADVGSTNVLTLIVDPVVSPSLRNVQRITGVVNGTTNNVPVEPVSAAIITGVSPANASRGQMVSVTLAGMGSGPFATDFDQASSIADFGDGVTVNSVTVNSATQLVANVTIADNAALGMRSISVETLLEYAVSVVAFNVQEGGISLGGTLIDSVTSNAIANAIISIEGTSYRTTSALDGSFSFSGLPTGIYTLLINSPNHELIRITVNGDAPRAIDLGTLPTAATVFDASAPAGVSLMSVVGRGFGVLGGGMELEKARELVRDAMLLVGGTEAGVLDADGNQLNPALADAGLLSITPDGLDRLAEELSRGDESIPLGTLLYGLSFGMAWSNGGPPSLAEWLDLLQDAVNAAWADPNNPQSALPIMIFNRGKNLSVRPPVISEQTQLNPLQAFLFTSSFFSYVVDRNINGNAQVLPPGVFDRLFAAGQDFIEAIGDMIAAPAYAQGPPPDRRFTGFWRGIASHRANFAEARLNESFMSYCATQYRLSMMPNSLGGVTTLALMAGQADDSLRELFAFEGRASRVPLPPKIDSVTQVSAPDGNGVQVEVEFNPSSTQVARPDENFVYALFRFDRASGARTLIDYVQVRGDTLVKPPNVVNSPALPVSEWPAAQFGQVVFTLRDENPLPTILDNLSQVVLAPKATWFYAVVTTLLQRGDDQVDRSLIEATLPWWSLPDFGVLQDSGLGPFALHNWQAMVSDYSDPVLITVNRFGPTRPPDEIEVAKLTGDVFYLNPTNQFITRIMNQGQSSPAYFSNAGFKYPPGAKGLAVDTDGNVYTENAASDEMYGGRIFRFDRFTGARDLAGALNYYSLTIQFANPVRAGPMDMGPGWNPANSPEDLYQVDELAEVVKKVPVQAPYDAIRRVGQPWAQIPYNALGVDLETWTDGNAALLVQRLASPSLDGRLQSDENFLILDDQITFTFEVSNPSQAVVFDVHAVSLLIDGDGLLALVTNSGPSSIDLNPGESLVYTSVYVAVSSGVVRVKGVAEGTDGGGTTVSSFPDPKDGIQVVIEDPIEILRVEPEEATIHPGDVFTMKMIVVNNAPEQLTTVTPDLQTYQLATNILGQGTAQVVQAISPTGITLQPGQQFTFTGTYTAITAGVVGFTGNASGFSPARNRTYDAKPKTYLVNITPFDFTATPYPSFVPLDPASTVRVTVTVANATSESFLNVEPQLVRDDGIGDFLNRDYSQAQPANIGPHETNHYTVILSQPTNQGVVVYRVDLHGQLSGGGNLLVDPRYVTINIGPIFTGLVTDVQMLLRTERGQVFTPTYRQHRPLPDVSVKMWDVERPVGPDNVYTGYTDAAGVFHIPVPKPGIYSLTAEHGESKVGQTFATVTAEYNQAETEFVVPASLVKDARRLIGELTNITYAADPQITFLFKTFQVQNTNVWHFQTGNASNFVGQFERGPATPKFRGIYRGPMNDYDEDLRRILGARLPDQWDSLQRLMLHMAFTKKRADEAAFFAFVNADFATAKMVAKLSDRLIKLGKKRIIKTHPHFNNGNKQLTQQQIEEQDEQAGKILDDYKKTAKEGLSKKRGDMDIEKGVEALEDWLFGVDYLDPEKEAEFFRRILGTGIVRPLRSKEIEEAEAKHLDKIKWEIIGRNLIRLRREITVTVMDGKILEALQGQAIDPLILEARKTFHNIFLGLWIIGAQMPLEKAVEKANDPQTYVQGSSETALTLASRFDEQIAIMSNNRRYYLSYVFPEIRPESEGEPGNPVVEKISGMVTALGSLQPQALQTVEQFAYDRVTGAIDGFLFTPIQIGVGVYLQVDLYGLQLGTLCRAQDSFYRSEHHRYLPPTARSLLTLVPTPAGIDEFIVDGSEDMMAYQILFYDELVLKGKFPVFRQGVWDLVKDQLPNWTGL